MRQILVKNSFGHKRGTRWRGHEVQRIEAFTDAVFAFAITLLAVSLEVPRSFNELLESMKGFVGFGFTFSFLFFIWYQHYDFFRRYGIDDRTIILLNGMFLLAVMFFIFPLKFMSYLIVTMVFNFTDENMHRIMSIRQVPQLLSLYMFGLSLLMLSFTLMYRHALKYRLHLELNDEETDIALRRYCSYLFSVPLLMMGVILYLLLPQNNTALIPLIALPLVIMNRWLKRKKIKVNWLMPHASEISNESNNEIVA
ncbi:MAG: DUF1211 domain-containing protein [Chitinophagales bacterium]|nr:DUF1211 domain-containing protein [Chitinophagales bacterium]